MLLNDQCWEGTKGTRHIPNRRGRPGWLEQRVCRERGRVGRRAGGGFRVIAKLAVSLQWPLGARKGLRTMSDTNVISDTGSIHTLRARKEESPETRARATVPPGQAARQGRVATALLAPGSVTVRSGSHPGPDTCQGPHTPGPNSLDVSIPAAYTHPHDSRVDTRPRTAFATLAPQREASTRTPTAQQTDLWGSVPSVEGCTAPRRTKTVGRSA